ncbi:MAG: DUF1801 domain-containing protein [Thermomicrobiales bacterium]|nr:DUF1801 domain-containing protein [Thermomicrobiales bacterium]
MNASDRAAHDVDAYIANFPSDVQSRLEEMRAVIREVAPEAEESISYGIPAYKLARKPLIYFAGYAKHLGLYPLPPDPDQELADAMAPYVAGKGTLRFPLEKPTPLDVVRRVVADRKRHLQPDA